MSRRLALPAAVAAALVGLLVAGSLPFYTRAEPREANAARAMVEGRGLLIPERAGDATSKKPPLYHWLAAAALRAGVQPAELAVRLPSVVLGALVVGATAGIGGTAYGTAAGVFAALALATSFEWFRAATQSRVDMTLTAFLSLATLGLWLGVTRDDRRWLRIGALAAALATLAKGPIGIVLPLAIVGVDALWSRDRGRLRRLLDPVAAACVLLPPACWYLLATEHGGAAVLRTQLLGENIERFLGVGDVPHRHGPLYYPPLLAGGLLPWTPAVAVGLRKAWRRRTAIDRLCLAWAGVILVFFSLAAGKRSVYLLPAYPPLALLAGPALVAWCARPATVRARRVAAASAAFVGLAALALSLPAVQAGLAELATRIVCSDRELLGPAFSVIATSPWRIPVTGLALALVLLLGIGGRTAAARGAGLVGSGLLLTVGTVFLGTLPLATALTPREFARAVERRVGPDGRLCALGPLPEDLRWYLTRPVPACELRCDQPGGTDWVVRTAAFDARRREACLRPSLTHTGTGPGDNLRLDRVTVVTAAEDPARTAPSAPAPPHGIP
ncbi:MAG: glycosyltransferase family 39 protein [bacterium]|nr:glycosyltransferase family 39 protein [bacterium]